MWAALPAIIALIARALTLLGITAFGWSLIKTGAVDQVSKGVGNVIEGAGDTVKAGGTVAKDLTKPDGPNLFGMNLGMLVALGFVGIIFSRR